MVKKLETDILIIGAGLTGLTLGYLLQEAGKKFILVEATNRIGGRIKTVGFETPLPIEMGATWFGSQHQMLKQLMNNLNVASFPQAIGDKAIYEAISTSPPYLASLPPNPDPTMRITGGTMRLIKALAEIIDFSNIRLNTKINQLDFSGLAINAFTEVEEIKAQKVISTIPPHLLYKTIQFNPALSSNIISVLKNTHTWMGESIKIALSYDDPFWRSVGSSGTIFSNVGPIPEMYDHSNYEDDHYALMGFLNGGYHFISKEERLEKILKQLQKYYGAQVKSFISYHEEVWNQNKACFAPYETQVLPHQNNGHELFKNPLYDKRFLIAGTETSSHFPGYMEGAVASAKFAFQFLK